MASARRVIQEMTEKTFVVASLKVDYIKQLTHPSFLEIGAAITHVGSKSFKITTGMFKKGSDQLIAVQVTSLVCFDFKTMKPIPIPQEIIHYSNFQMTTEKIKHVGEDMEELEK